ncbi:MAG: oligoendopeptidase F [Vicinamibacterales bacterium]
MTFFAPADSAEASVLRERGDIDERYRWNLESIFPDWAAWSSAYSELERKIDEFAGLRGSLARGGTHLLAALELRDLIGRLSYKVWYFASLWYDQDQRDNTINAQRQQVQILFAKSAQASSWFDPELLAVPLATVQAWLAESSSLAVYRFAVEDLYRQQEHVLDENGERLLSFSSRFASAPIDAYSSLTTADMKPPTITLPSGGSVTLTYGQYRALLATNRSQDDRAAAFQAFHESYDASANTYAALYNGVLQRDWFYAQARGYTTTLAAALHGNNIPAAVVENLVSQTKAGTAPLHRYHRVRRQALGLSTYHTYDSSIPLVEFEQKYPYDDVLEWLPLSVAPLGADYQRRMREVLDGRCIDVYENKGKRSGAYSAPVYGCPPFMLLNYNDTLDAVFTLAHEFGHSMHTVLAHANQPFVYANYTIFVAEVPSTLNEALLLRFMLERSTSPRERIVLLQHAIDAIVGTFYTQVMFADFELQAHRCVEAGKPITAEVLGDIYFDLLKTYYGDAIEYDEGSRITWARIPHFFGSPYYVYQYATCYASSAQILKQILGTSNTQGTDAVSQYLTLLKSGGCDHPMTLLKHAGVDLGLPEPVQAVVQQLDALVTQLEDAVAAL